MSNKHSAFIYTLDSEHSRRQTTHTNIPVYQYSVLRTQLTRRCQNQMAWSEPDIAPTPIPSSHMSKSSHKNRHPCVYPAETIHQGNNMYVLRDLLVINGIVDLYISKPFKIYINQIQIVIRDLRLSPFLGMLILVT